MAKPEKQIFLLLGEDEYLLEENAEKLTKGFTEVVKVSALDTELTQIRNDLCSLGFFTDSKAVVIEDLEKLDVSTGEALVGLLEVVAENVRAVFKARKLEGNRKWVKALKAGAELVDCSSPKPYEITKLLDKKIGELGLGRTEAEYLKEALPKDLLAAYNELEKLSLYPGKLSLSTLKLLIEPALENQVFAMMDFLVRQDLKNSLTTLKELLAAGNEPLAVLGAIIWQIRTLYKVSGYSGSSPTKDLGISEFQYKKAAGALRQVSRGQIEQWFLLALDADMSIKSGLFRPDAALEVLVTKMCLNLPPKKPLVAKSTS
ncbi:MAG: DNA polymerase III subunit delta [Bacillota bacterium]|jgi:DNA polymerase-3 subunit delta|nr:DNA polymerase III subunit delta [Bacillota bacterium]HOP53913.1 DNA polymerase III subunit delta [Bacillota bacterium]HPT60043.1 DNA polymerase III subunit delta [Bacillota bacterium]